VEDQLKKTLILGGIAIGLLAILILVSQNSINNRMFREIDDFRDETSNAFAQFLAWQRERRSEEDGDT